MKNYIKLLIPIIYIIGYILMLIGIKNQNPYLGSFMSPTASMGDGEYSVELELSGGSGRASIQSPTSLYIDDGKMSTKIVWSSPNYDYMIINGEKLLPINTEGNSTFIIPVDVLDEPITVIADTTAMSVPHEIEYQITLNSKSLFGKVSLTPTNIAIIIVCSILLLISIASIVITIMNQKAQQEELEIQ